MSQPPADPVDIERARALAVLHKRIPQARTCQWFVSESHLGPDATKCGAPTTCHASGRPSAYCDAHHARAWVPVPKKKPGAVPLHLYPMVARG